MIEERIRKLLDIAGDPAASEAERDNALAIAARLAAKHDIDMHGCRSQAELDYGMSVCDQWSRRPHYAPPIGCILTMFFGVTSVRCVRPAAIGVFGTASSRAIAVYVYAVLKRQFLAAHSVWASRQKKRPNADMCRGFYQSVAAGLSHRLEGERETLNQQMGLIVAPDLSVPMAAFFGRELQNAEVKKGRLTSEGFEAGKRIAIRPGLKSSATRQPAVSTTRRLFHGASHE
jgi:hypothetical protein